MRKIAAGLRSDALQIVPDAGYRNSRRLQIMRSGAAPCQIISAVQIITPGVDASTILNPIHG
jgi:hypothetical protein